jgi:hypothetical protein
MTSVDVKAEFDSAKDVIRKANDSIREAQATNAAANLTQMKSTAAGLARELKELGGCYNAATIGTNLKENLAVQIAAMNVRVVAFSDDVNAQLTKLRNDVGVSDDVSIETWRQRVSSKVDRKVPTRGTVLALAAGVVGCIAWAAQPFNILSNRQVIGVNTAANSWWAAMLAGVAAAALVLFIESFFVTKKSDDTTPPLAPAPARLVKRVSIWTTNNDRSPDLPPTQIIPGGLK